MTETNPIFDGHLDLSMNVRRGRDITQPASAQPVVDNEIATVGLPDLHRGNVRRICATIFCLPSIAGAPGYTTAQEAFDEANTQLAIYQQILPAADGLDATILIEGADCVRDPADLALFWRQGVRIIGLAWQRTRYSGGSGAPGPLTAIGQELVKEMDQIGFVHDASHLAEESFWNLMDIVAGPVIASHSNCRAIVGDDPKERHLSDDMIR
ncbi:MAG: membrane dipeptidase, partial [Burkholderiales bacterium]|nr:membrane dipeptidase [Phycisphaerae bacterium]